MTVNIRELRKSLLHDLKSIAGSLRDLRYFVEKYQSGLHHASILAECDRLVTKHDTMFARMEDLLRTLEKET